MKREALEGQARVEELYLSALDAMRSYSGSDLRSDEVVDED